MDAAKAAHGAVRVVMLGPPGSGKGTQAAILAERSGIPAISTGDMLRQAVAAGSDLGRKVEGLMNSGALVDDVTMAEVVEARLQADDTAAGFLLDGYPRNLEQAATLEGILDRLGVGLGGVLFLDVPEDELVQRALGRGRADDTEDVIRERLRVYREKTQPLVEHYRGQGILHAIDSDRAIDIITEDLSSALRHIAAQ